MSDTVVAGSAVAVSLMSGGGNKEPPPPPWFHFWDLFESRIGNFDRAEPSALCVTVRTSGRVFWTSLAGVARKNLDFTFLSPHQFEMNGKGWKPVPEIDIRFRISKTLSYPEKLADGSIKIVTEDLEIKIYPYGTVTFPALSR